MRYVHLHHGQSMPALGFGTWRLEGSACEQALTTALEVGYRHIDTAQVYGNEAEIGRVIAACGVAREALFITTKLWMTDYARDRVAPAVEESLRKLRTTYVDLLLMHWPEPTIPMQETLHALCRLQEQGMVRSLGVSNFPVALMREAVEEHGVSLACNQVEYHALLSQQPVLAYARAQGMAVTAYCPLARGAVIQEPVLAGIGASYGKTAGQVALRWLVEQEGVAAIPKAASEAHIRHNFDIFDFALTAEEHAQIQGLQQRNLRTVNPAFAPVWDAG